MGALCEKSWALPSRSSAGTGGNGPSGFEKYTKLVSALRMTRYCVGGCASWGWSPFINLMTGVLSEPYSRQMALSGVKPPNAGSWQKFAGDGEQLMMPWLGPSIADRRRTRW